jgi:hypothetical protein
MMNEKMNTKMKSCNARIAALGVALACSLLLLACATQLQHSVTWNIDSLSLIGSAPVSVLGEPVVVSESFGGNLFDKAIRFDGEDDRLLVNANPLGAATEFTIEIIFNPADAYPNNLEPRFFHIESPDNPNRRVTIELRLNDKQQWYLDAYIKSENSQYTLIDATKVHPIGKWAHAAITYKNREFVSYVNGQRELVGQVDYLPIAANGKTSIGARMNQVHWYKGEIAWVRISKKALTPDEFALLEKD